MTNHYETLLETQRGPYTVIVDKTYEYLHPGELFDDSCHDIKEICERIDRGYYDWFMLRARVMLEDVELSSDYLGGCLYEDAREVLTDGVAEDLIYTAMESAKKQAVHYKRIFHDLVV